MATILNGDIQVDYFADNRQKRLSWLGGTNDTYTMNQIYSAMATLLDETTTIDDGSCFSAETPTEYTIGKIDTGDNEPWYITFDLMEHVTGGALRTSGWLRAEGTNTGILVVPVTAAGSTITSAKEGLDISHGDGDAGTLLEYIDTGGTNDYCVIRPDSSAAANSFDSGASGTLTCDGETASQAGSGTSGEMIWAGLYSIGTIDSNVHQYLYQGDAATDGDKVRLSSWNDATQDWYGNGHIDIVVPIKEFVSSTWAVIDEGYITVLARKYGDLYASFEVACSTTSGGYNPIPLQTAADLDNTTGLRSVTLSGLSGDFAVGDRVTGDTSNAEVILTDVSGSPTMEYIIIGDPQTDFNGSEAVTNETQTGSASSSGATSAVGPSETSYYTNTTLPTISFTHTEADINDDASNEYYGIVIDCKSNPLSEVYEWCKWQTRNGEVTNDLDGINGESYIGAEVYIKFSSESTAIGEGEDVVQEGSGATGIVISYDTTAKVMLLRNTRGTFVTGSATDSTITSNDSSGEVEMETGGGAVVNTFAPKTASPLMTFAGGTAFGARGVLLQNYIDADANSFILTPAEGGTAEVPASVGITVSNLVGGAATSDLHDKVAVFRLTGSGGDINKAERACVGGESPGDTTIATDAISVDTPGKASGGVLVLVDADDGGQEYKIRFSSWSGSTFTLANSTGTTEATTNATQLTDDEGDFTNDVLRGDLVYTSKGSAQVKTVDSGTQLTLESPGITGLTAGDAYEINAVPITTTSSDKVFVPFMDRVALSDTETASFRYNAQVFYRAKVRNTRAATKIKPFSVDGNTSGGDISVATIRTTDTIIS